MEKLASVSFRVKLLFFLDFEPFKIYKVSTEISRFF